MCGVEKASASTEEDITNESCQNCRSYQDVIDDLQVRNFNFDVSKTR